MKKTIVIAAAVVLVVLAAVFAAGCTSSDSAKVITGYNDLYGAKIGVQTGTTGDVAYVSEIEKADPSTKVERYTNIVDGVQSLKQGKLDCVVIDSEIAKNYATEGSGLKLIYDDAFASEDYAFAVKKGNDELLYALNTAMDELKADGTFDKINKYYLGFEGGEQYKKVEGINYKSDLKVATHAEFKPYEYKEEGKFLGIDMDVMQAIADKLQYQLVINDIDFGSILLSVQTGKDDVGASAITVTDERKKNVDFTDPYVTATQVIIVRA
ncbi:MAG TPA: transporter substrate-binding domain-containing protein [Methanocorpusculum sp.]|nr:transporter substrate-binding domain-containing protein [Methanocorpusculum sp.]